jgi:predicted transglutaminase-like cysteine proteinase
LVNRAINAAIRPQADVADEWYPPLETISRGTADCEDYAIVKLLALRWLGWSASDLALVVIYDPRLRQYHAVAAARTDGAWLILDCNTLTLVAPEATRYDPRLLIRDGRVQVFQPQR